MKLARLHKLANTEPYWHVHLAVLCAVSLQFTLNDKLTVGPKYVIAGFEILLVLLLAVFSKRSHKVIVHLRRSLAIILLALISAANITSLVLIVHDLFGGKQVSGKQLIVSGLSIYLTNIIIFGLWYWELDSTGSQGQDS